jgi:dihydroorotase
MLEFFHNGKITLEQIVQKMAHNPAILFRIKDRGFIREGYYADLVIADMNKSWTVERKNILAKCGWSPFEGQLFQSSIIQTFVSGHLAYDAGKLVEGTTGRRLSFQI